MNSELDGTARRPIANASAAVAMHPQTLRKYERAGLLRPARREGGARHYSDDDLARLALIKHLAEARHINVAGMRLALELRDELAQLLVLVGKANAPSREKVTRERLEHMLQMIEQEPMPSPIQGM
ncbi:MAG: MerR family transcriptional regulator [Tepidiformaceae bacterium]